MTKKKSIVIIFYFKNIIFNSITEINFINKNIILRINSTNEKNTNLTMK